MNRSSRSVSFSPRKEGNLQFQFTDLKKKIGHFLGGFVAHPHDSLFTFFSWEG